VQHSAQDRDVSTFLGQAVSPEGVVLNPVEQETISWSFFKGC